jgi:hypothetical protein
MFAVAIAVCSSRFSSPVNAFGVAAMSTRGCLLFGNFRWTGLYFIPFRLGVERRDISFC